jgi:hypothetical protein
MNVVFNGGSISGFYFILVPVDAGVYTYKTSFTQDATGGIFGPSYPGPDRHSMFTMHHGDMVLEDGRYTARSGQGFWVGSQVATMSSTPEDRRKFVLLGTSVVSGIDVWTVPTYIDTGYLNNLQLHLRGTYPNLKSFVYSINVTPDSGDRICRYSGNTLLACEKPLLPITGTAEPTAAGANLLANAGAEQDISIFKAYRGSALSRDTVSPRVGAASLRIDHGGTYIALPTLTPGRQYVFSMWARGTANARLNWTLQSGSGDLNCLSGAAVLSADWRNYNKTCTLDASKPYLYIFTNSLTDTYWIDDIKIRQI